MEEKAPPVSLKAGEDLHSFSERESGEKSQDFRDIFAIQLMKAGE